MRLASAAVAANADTAVYTVPNAKRAIVTVNACNRSNAVVKLRLAITTGPAPADADWIEYDTPVPAAGSVGGSVLTRSGIALGAGQKLYVRTDLVGLSVVVLGLEEGVV